MKTTLIIGLAAGLLTLASCSSKNNEQAQNKEEVPTVKTMTVEKKTIERKLTYSATIMALEENHLAPATAGRVDKILVDVGDVVSRGQVVVMLDRTNYNQAKIQYEKLTLDFMRMDSLLKAGGVSKQQYEQLKMQLDVAKNNLDFLDENTTLRSPINGVVTGKYLNDGEMFAMSPAPGIGKPAIVSIMNLSSVKLLVAVPESYLPNLRKGMDCSVYAEIYPDKKFTGKIQKIYPIVDNMTKTVTVEIVVPNAQLILRPGMFAKAELYFGDAETILVPSYAVLKQVGSNERYVFVFKDGKAIRKVVQIGMVLDDMLEIINGLTLGEELIYQGHTSLLDGMNVQKK